MTDRGPTVDAYHRALRDYLLRSDESGLTHAYDLGRDGLDAGCGLMQILHVHEKALGVILDSTPVDAEVRRRVNESVRFLLEALSPFGMASDGYVALLKTR
ncbi:MAG TPA: phosphatase RsbU N-terminal domain-containing protein [Thermoanaerobaculia bacterium]|jgi:hypothetical protein